MGSEIVKQAAEKNSTNVVIAPEIKGSVSKAEVTIPSATVEQIGSKTAADLTVSTPAAAVTIPNGALSGLAESGEKITVTAGQTGNTVELTLAAGGKTVESIPGGVKVTVPVAEPTPGTVAFASSHELFSGTGETEFSPDLPMTRGMLAVVLHNLENNPSPALTGTFDDVDGAKWYAEGVAWAAEKGIVTGYSSSRFGPEDHITREQLAVMLWRYAGSPAAAEGELDFSDADKTSAWALEAMRWATQKGILSGKGNGILDPTGKATRAQTAQMLKNFMENR